MARVNNALVLCLALMLPGIAAADLYERSPGGWVWYDDSQKEAPPPPKEEKAVASPASGKTAKDTLRLMGEQMEEAEAGAVLNPTTDNIKKAIVMKKQMLALTQTYADRYEQVVWKNPDLDYTLERPMRTDTLFAANPVKKERLHEGLKKAAGSNALVYVFRSDCPYCKKFSPLLKEFAEEHGFAIMAVTLDGQGNSDFPYPKRDLSVLKAKNMMPKVVPALYLVNPRQDNVEAVGFGLMNIVDLENRVALAAGINIYSGVTAANSNANE